MRERRWLGRWSTELVLRAPGTVGQQLSAVAPKPPVLRNGRELVHLAVTFGAADRGVDQHGLETRVS